MLFNSTPADIQKFCSQALASWPMVSDLEDLLGAELDQEVTDVPGSVVVIKPIDHSDEEKSQFGPFIVNRGSELIVDIWGQPEWKVVYSDSSIQDLQYEVDFNPVILSYKSVGLTRIEGSLYLVHFELRQVR